MSQKRLNRKCQIRTVLLLSLCFLISQAAAEQAKSKVPYFESKVPYFGFEDAINRTNSPCRVLAKIEPNQPINSVAKSITLKVPEGLTILSGPEIKIYPKGLLGEHVHQEIVKFDPKKRAPWKEFELEESGDFVWQVVAAKPGEYKVEVTFTDENKDFSSETVLKFTKSLGLAKYSYVPTPRPIETDIDVCTYYFPGWFCDKSWDALRQLAPERKPVLGWYDDSNPECIDWEIKWAVENGISCIFLDSYWENGQPRLNNWIDTYRKAKYRDYLKIAIMYTNHYPKNINSAEDWRNLLQIWIDDYFSMDSYYCVDGKPVVLIFDPSLLRTVLGGSANTKKILEESQQIAKRAGYKKGIKFVAMAVRAIKGDDEYSKGCSAEDSKILLEEGYTGITGYHEFVLFMRSISRTKFKYEEVVEKSPILWKRKDEITGDLTYYPVVSTGREESIYSHKKGQKVPRGIYGRTPELFEQLLREAKSYCKDNSKEFMVIAPWNEWTEASYLGPCTEFGFGMFEAIRKVLGKGNPNDWPVNFAPSDVGLGPYNFPKYTKATSWTFEEDFGGWKTVKNVADLRCEKGTLRLRTTSADPAIRIYTEGLMAAIFPKAVINMQLIGDIPQGAEGQFFWSAEENPPREALSIKFKLARDSKPHTYELDLGSLPLPWHWYMYRFDLKPCNAKDVEVIIDNFRFIEIE